MQLLPPLDPGGATGWLRPARQCALEETLQDATLAERIARDTYVSILDVGHACDATQTTPVWEERDVSLGAEIRALGELCLDPRRGGRADLTRLRAFPRGTVADLVETVRSHQAELAALRTRVGHVILAEKRFFGLYVEAVEWMGRSLTPTVGMRPGGRWESREEQRQRLQSARQPFWVPSRLSWLRSARPPSLLRRTWVVALCSPSPGLGTRRAIGRVPNRNLRTQDRLTPQRDRR